MIPSIKEEINLSFIEQENEPPDHLSPAYLSKYTQFFVTSNNPIIAKFEIYGYYLQPPKLVYKGDLDSDGKDEWGYLVTGENSQWRQYNVLNYDFKNKKWEYLDKPFLKVSPFTFGELGCANMQKTSKDAWKGAYVPK